MELQRLRREEVLPRGDLLLLLGRVQDDLHGHGRPHAVRVPQGQQHGHDDRAGTGSLKITHYDLSGTA